MTRILLAALAALPAFAFAYGTREGQVAFVTYREPKLAAIQFLGWLLLILLFWRRGLGSAPWPRFHQLRQPATALVALFVALLALSGLWAKVIENYIYEIFQYLLLFVLFLVLREWGSTDSRVRGILLYSHVGSLALVTLVGIVQLFQIIPQLSPIDPHLGVDNPSFMGYKNPMALSLLGQIYLLAFLVFKRSSSGRQRLFWATLMGAELFYLATLESRTAYTAFVLSALLLVPLVLLRALREKRLLPVAAATFVLAGLFLGGVLWSPSPRQRLGSIRELLIDGSLYLESNRSIFALNTLGMVADRPFGVGLGNWQTFYPVYRAHGRYNAFGDETQVRRAHGDYMQFLGEIGWQGLALWLALLVVFVSRAARRYFRDGEPLFLFAGVQLFALAVAMALDYYVEIPYNKFQLFLLLSLIAIEPGEESREPRRGTPHAAARLTLTLLGIVCSAYAGSLALRGFHAADLRWTYERLQQASPGSEEEARLMVSAEASGRKFRRLVGHDKTLHKDYLILGHLAFLKGDSQTAFSLVETSLKLHPYYPNAFKMLALMTRDIDREAAETYLATYEYIMHQAETGFEHTYPRLP